MEQIQKHGETCAAEDGFPTLLLEAMERGLAVKKPEYHVFKQKMHDGATEYWARVIIFNSHQPGARTFMFSGARTQCVTQAIQSVAYQALARLRHEFQFMDEARATRFFPQYSVESEVHYYEDTNGENDPAIVGLASYVKALDSVAQTALAEVDMLRNQMRDIEAALKTVLARNQEAPPVAAPQDEVRDIHEVPAPEPPRKKRFRCGNSRRYLRRFTNGTGPSRPAREPTPVEDEEEEDPEEVIPIHDEEE